MKIEIVFLIGIIIAVLLVIILILGLRAESRSISGTIYPPIKAGLFNYSCVDRPCGQGLICDSEFNVCKLDVGAECTTGSKCVTGSYCAGTCISDMDQPSAMTGLTGGYCPCDYNTHSCVNGICLSLYECSINNDCVTGSCINGMCSSRADNGMNCINDSQCNSSNCSLGICQIPGATTGEIGSYCTDTCNGVLICDTGVCRLP